MNVFEAVKQSVTTRQAAEHYGIHVGRNGMACCPFHNDKTPSMKLDRRYHCFGCGADGDVIDFAAALYGLGKKEAAVQLAQDFGLSYEDWKPPGKAKKPKPRQKSPEEQFQEAKNRCFRILADYLHLLMAWRTDYAPHSPEEAFHPRFVEALQKQAQVEYLLYVLLFAITYGQQQATFSSILAVAGYLAVQMYQRSGFDVVLDVNTYIWIAQLLILGLVIGYMRDRLHAVEEEERHEVDFLSRQVEDISDVNGSNVRIKEILSNQIVNQNDSFGKLYEITSSLDKYEPSEVLFYAAEVLAKLMDSQDVAIYTVANHSYARLFSATSPKARMLGNSIHYVQMEELYEKLREKKVFINKTMDERYPLMADAIYSEDEMQLILMVWGLSLIHISEPTRP
mgnify:CR=1 FL=1